MTRPHPHRVRRHLVLPALVLLPACAPAAPRPPPPPVVRGSVAPPPRAEDWGVPNFFEVGEAVTPAPGAIPIDTRRWLDALLVERGTSERDCDRLGRRAFVYSEPDALGGTMRRFALVLPPARPYVTNGLAVARWGAPPSAFDFGLDDAHTFGTVTSAAAPASSVRQLIGRFTPSGTNAQDAELLFDVEGTPFSVLEHKGLVSGARVSYERFAIYDRTKVPDDQEPTPAASARSPSVTIGARPSGGARWRALETFPLRGQRIVYLEDEGGGRYFIAAPLAVQPSWFFGGLGTDLVPQGAAADARERAANEPAAALLFARAPSATVLFGRVDDEGDIAGAIDRAADYLERLDADARSLRGDRAIFLRDYARALVQSHQSRRDPRSVTELPYGDRYYPSDVAQASASVGFGTDEASVLHGLIAYFHATGDRGVLPALEGLSDASAESLTPSGSVWTKRFDEMLITTETDPRTGRADAFIENGGVSVTFNHRNLVVARGDDRAPGVTWGALGAIVDGRITSVDDGSYDFSVESASVPRTFATDQEALEISRLFTRADGKVRFRESAVVSRGLPFARIDSRVQNTGRGDLALDQVLVTIGDFLHYGNGTGEIAQNRYGFSRLLDGVPLHVGFWMDGMPEPLWGDSFAPGWVDVTEQYERYRPRFVCVFGYDKAELYFFSRAPDAMFLRNVGDDTSAKDGYRGWTTLRLRYDARHVLAPGATYESPPVYTYPLWAPLCSADADTVPDELQSTGPLWSELVETLKDDASEADRDARLRSLRDPAKAARLRALLHTSLESDRAYASMQAAWAEAADLFGQLARKAANERDASDLSRRARLLRRAALAGAEFSLRAYTHLRNRVDLWPAYGAGDAYGFQMAIFDWAYRQTCDDRFRDAALRVADAIASSEQRGGLQVTDPRRPDRGGYVANELSHAAGTKDLADQGAKLWALRIAYERTGDPKYRASAALCIDGWVKVQRRDGAFFGMTKVVDGYAPTGPEQGRTPRGHYLMMLGLRAWSDLHPRARELWEEGIRYATERHQIHSLGATGVYDMAFADEGRVDFTTRADVAGIALWALSLPVDALLGRWSTGCARRSP